MAKQKHVTDNNSEVSKNGKRVIWLRASSVKELLDCPSRWQANNTASGIPAIPTSIKGHTGTCVHKATEIYDKKYLGTLAPSTPVDEHIKGALRAFNYAFQNPKFPVRETEAKDLKKMREVGHKLVARYIEEIAPTLVYSHIELKCKPYEIDVGNIIFSLTGGIDRLYLPDPAIRRHGIADLKTGVQAVNAQNEVEVVAHKAQLGIYEILGEHTIREEITAQAKIIGMQTNSMARVAIGETMSARDVVLGTAENSGILAHAGKLIEHGIFFGNPSSMMCNPDYCRRYKTCHYRGADAVEIAQEAEHLVELADEKRNAALTSAKVDDIYAKINLPQLLVVDEEPVDVQVDAEPQIDLSKLLVHA